MALISPWRIGTFSGVPKIFLKAKSTVGLMPRLTNTFLPGSPLGSDYRFLLLGESRTAPQIPHRHPEDFEKNLRTTPSSRSGWARPGTRIVVVVARPRVPPANSRGRKPLLHGPEKDIGEETGHSVSDTFLFSPQAITANSPVGGLIRRQVFGLSKCSHVGPIPRTQSGVERPTQGFRIARVPGRWPRSSTDRLGVEACGVLACESGARLNVQRGNRCSPLILRDMRRDCRNVASSTTRRRGHPGGTSGFASGNNSHVSSPHSGVSSNGSPPPYGSTRKLLSMRAARRPVLLVSHASRTWRMRTISVFDRMHVRSEHMHKSTLRKHRGQRPLRSRGVLDRNAPPHALIPPRMR